MFYYNITQNAIFNNLSFNFLVIFLFSYFINIFLLFVLFGGKYLNTNNFLKIIKILILKKKNYYPLLIVFSSLVGVPPLNGFITKFFLIFFVTFKTNVFNLILIYLFILFNVFFYLQFFKLINKKKYVYTDILLNNKKLKNKNNTYFKFFLINILIIFIFFFIFFFKDFIFFIFLLLN